MWEDARAQYIRPMAKDPDKPVIETQSKTGAPEVEILNNFWPFRFSKGVLIFIFIQNANLAVQIFGKMFTFSISSNHKSGRPDFWKDVHIFNFFKSQIWPSRFLKRCSHLRF